MENKLNIRMIDRENEKSAIASQILNALPDWFGIPESVAQYVRESRAMPFWTAFSEEAPVGFISLRETSPVAGEIYVMGVRQDQHRDGVGRQLFQALEAYAKEVGYSFLQVKTVQMGHYEIYDRTNRLYLAMGFQELECIPELWDEHNPCQIYVKYIGR